MEMNHQKVTIKRSNIVTTVALSIFYSLCLVFPPKKWPNTQLLFDASDGDRNFLTSL